MPMKIRWERELTMLIHYGRSPPSPISHSLHMRVEIYNHLMVFQSGALFHNCPLVCNKSPYLDNFMYKTTHLGLEGLLLLHTIEGKIMFVWQEALVLFSLFWGRTIVQFFLRVKHWKENASWDVPVSMQKAENTVLARLWWKILRSIQQVRKLNEECWDDRPGILVPMSLEQLSGKEGLYQFFCNDLKFQLTRSWDLEKPKGAY